MPSLKQCIIPDSTIVATFSTRTRSKLYCA